MKKTNQTQNRVAALSLATIISLNMTPAAFAQPDVTIPGKPPSLIEMEEVEGIKNVELEDIKIKLDEINEVEDKEQVKTTNLEEDEQGKDTVEDESVEEILDNKNNIEIETQDEESIDIKPAEEKQNLEGVNPYSLNKIENTKLKRSTIEGDNTINSVHTLRASGDSKNGVLYRFFVKDLSTNKWTMIQDYSEKSSAEWIPTKEGNYWYGVHIKDKNSKEDLDVLKYSPITIEGIQTTQLNSSTIEGDNTINSVHTLRASGDSKNGVLYRFFVKDLSTNKWTMIQDYSEKSSAEWIPTKEGNYWYGVHIKDKNSKEDLDVLKYSPITIEGIQTTQLNSSTIEGDNTINSVHTLRASGDSKNGVLYRFFVKDLSTNKWTMIQDYSEKSSAEWIPTKEGNYWYGVHIKDKNSKEDLDVLKYSPITIEGIQTTQLNSSTIEGDNTINSVHTLRASGDSKNGVLYRFFVKDLSTNKWTMIQDYSEKSSAEWIPTKEGNYWHGVHIKDKKSKEDLDVLKYSPITIGGAYNVELKDFTIEGNNLLNSPHILRAEGSSKNGILYKFFIKDLNINKWIMIQDYSEKNSAKWTPTKEGNYWYGVHVKDKKSNKDLDKLLYKTVNILPFEPAKAEEITISGSGYQKTNHVLKAKASGTNKVLYKFYVQDLSTNKTTIIQDYSSNTTANWKPQDTGNYLYGVHVKDEKSKDDKDDEIYNTINIRSTLEYNVSHYGDTLEEALDKQMNVSGTKNQISKAGKWVDATRDEVKDYLDPSRFLQIELEASILEDTEGTITANTLNVRSGPSASYGVIGTTSKGTVHKFFGEIDGWYLIEISGVRGWISGSYINFTDVVKGETKPLASVEITVSGLNVRELPNSNSTILTTVTRGDIYMVLENKDGWYKIKASGKTGWISGDYASSVNDVPREMYQFMILSGQAGVTTAQMNAELKGQGILEGEGDAFLEGSRKYNVNELYLMAHAFLETGKGTSQLAKGVLVNTVDNKPVAPRIVYNMYGIGAYDNSALKSGSECAYKEGWFTPEIAIIEGAHWISNNYINNATYKQDTLYKMKWNPVKPGTHQYATDVGWALKQTRQIDLMMEFSRSIEGSILKFDIPKYNNKK